MKKSAGDGIRTREGTHPLGPQPSAFDRSTTPAVLILTQESKAYHHLSLSLFEPLGFSYSFPHLIVI